MQRSFALSISHIHISPILKQKLDNFWVSIGSVSNCEEKWSPFFECICLSCLQLDYIFQILQCFCSVNQRLGKAQETLRANHVQCRQASMVLVWLAQISQIVMLTASERLSELFNIARVLLTLFHQS